MISARCMQPVRIPCAERGDHQSPLSARNLFSLRACGYRRFSEKGACADIKTPSRGLITRGYPHGVRDGRVA